MKYKFLDIVRADTAFDAYGKDLNELFANAAEAVSASMVDLKTLKATKTKEIKLKCDEMDRLLYDFLEEIVFLKDSEQLFFKEFKVKVTEKPPKLTAKIKGEKLNMEKHKLGVDVKAVTMHEFKLEKTKTGYKARVVLDV